MRQYKKLIYLDTVLVCIYQNDYMFVYKYSILCTACLVVFDVDMDSIVVQPLSIYIMVCVCVCMCGFCTVWMCGAFCNIVGVCMVGIVIVWVFW